MYLIQHVGPFGKENVIILKDKVVSLADNTVEIFPQEDGTFRLVAHYKISLSGQEMIGQKILTHNMIITCPNGDIYTYRDDKAQVAWRKKLHKIERCTELEGKYNPETIKIFKNRDYAIFNSENRYSSKLLAKDGYGLVNRFTFFAKARYRFERRIFYIIREKKCEALLAICPEEKYCTPETIIRKTLKEQAPLFFTLGKTKLTSLSIIENNVQYAFCAPIIYRKKTLAVFYVDSQNSVHDFAYIGLGHICEKTGKIMSKLIKDFEPPNLKILEV